jgi:hypothetical protein
MKNLKGKKLMYRWSGCACSEGKEQEVNLRDWRGRHFIWGWDGNLSIVGSYEMEDIIRRLKAGESEVRIQTVCSNCLGTGEDIYYFKPIG